MSDEEMEIRRFMFLSRLIQKSPMTVGEDMYRVGQDLGFNKQLVDNIVSYYHNNRVIEFPILGSYIKLVRDWYNVLNERDRKLLREGFLLKLEELSNKDPCKEITTQDVFDLMGYRAYSESLIPMIVDSLFVDGFVITDNNIVVLTGVGRESCSLIKERNKKLHEQTLKRLNSSHSTTQ